MPFPHPTPYINVFPSSLLSLSVSLYHPFHAIPSPATSCSFIPSSYEIMSSPLHTHSYSSCHFSPFLRLPSSNQCHPEANISFWVDSVILFKTDDGIPPSISRPPMAFRHSFLDRHSGIPSPLSRPPMAFRYPLLDRQLHSIHRF